MRSLGAGEAMPSTRSLSLCFSLSFPFFFSLSPPLRFCARARLFFNPRTQEKYYPGDRVCVLVRAVADEKVDMSRWTEKRKKAHALALAEAKHAVSEVGLAEKADANGDGQIDAAELEALAKDVPRGRTGVVCKFADGGNRVVIEFDAEV